MEENRQSGPGKKRPSRVPKIVAVAVLICLAVAFIGADYALHQIEPVLRARVIQSLSTRFKSQVQLGEFHVSIADGLVVEGKNLSLRSDLYPDLPPQIEIGKFSFHAGLISLFQSPMRVAEVDLHGLTIKIPPKSERAAMPAANKHEGKLKIVIGRIVCDNALLVLLTDNPGKTPLQFKIHRLTLDSVAAHQPMHFKAQLINPKPIGDIATEGNFGPWNANGPHNTHVDGKYSFTHADLGTIKGIAGMLSSKGKYSGKLDTINVDGTTDTPDFSVNFSGHKVALHTDFHAIVNGTNGNTYLQPVRAHFLNTDVTAAGTVLRGPAGHGHDIHLNVQIEKGSIQDLLQIGAKTNRPIMTGSVHLKTRFDLPTGEQTVIHRLQLQGAFAIDNVLFTSFNLQKGMDELSLRGQGKTGETKQLGTEAAFGMDSLPKIPASIRGVFSMKQQKLTFPQLVCKLPGAEIAVNGVYTLDGKKIDFNGHARLQARLSSIVGGWKGKLLTPIDPFFAKHGAGTEVPIAITGTESHPHFGLNF